MSVRLAPAAEADVEGVLTWYQERSLELGDQFLQVLDECLESIGRNPQAFPIAHRDIRRALLHRFPFCAFYVVSELEVVVLACLHGHRDPHTWKRRRKA